MIEISVVVPCHDPDPDQLDEQFAALAGQRTERTFEVVVVDNGSTPPLAGRMPARIGPARVRVVDMSVARGVNIARAAGVRAAAADRILLCDADDIVEPTWLEAAARHLDDDVLVAGPRTMFFDTPGDVDGMTQDRLQTKFGRSWSSGSNMGFTRRAIETAGGFDESWPAEVAADDVDLWLRAADAGVEVRFDQEMANNYRLRSGLRTVLRQRRRYGRGAIRLADRHQPEHDRAALRRSLRRGVVRLAKFAPRAITDPMDRWHLARRAGMLLGQAEGLLRPVHSAPARGMAHDLVAPSVGVVLSPDHDDVDAAVRELTRRFGPDLTIAMPAGAVTTTPHAHAILTVADDGSPAEVRDRALGALTTDLVLFAETPGSLTPTWIERQVDILRVFDVSVGAGDMTWIPSRRRGPRPELAWGSIGVRRRELLEVGGFTGGDEDLGDRLLRSGLRIAHDRGPAATTPRPSPRSPTDQAAAES
ncbi:MAG: glycosyltransferase [Actinomycetota bacterium]